MYDEFRELWGALSLVVGGKIQWAGGGAAGLDHASPLTSFVYAVAIWINPSESAPLALECYIFSAGLLAFWFTSRSTWVRLCLMVAATSAYRLIDIRSGMDQIGMLGVGFGLAAILQHFRWRLHAAWLPWLGLCLGLLPHLHASGIFVALAIGLAFLSAQSRISIPQMTSLVSFALLPMGYWLIDAGAVDSNRGWPYVHWTALPSNIWHAVLGTFKADATWFQDRGLTSLWWGYLYRLTVSGFWIASLVYISQHLSRSKRGLVLLFWLVLLARSDYMLVTQHLVAIAIVCMLATRPVHAPAWLTVWAVGCIVLQLPLTLQTQLQAHDHGFYRVPYQYFLLATPGLQTGEGSMVELPTAVYRQEQYRQRAAHNDKPLLSPESHLTVSDILAFAPTGFLHMTDLMDSAPRAVLEELSSAHPKLRAPLQATIHWSRMQLADLSSERLFGSAPSAHKPENNRWTCVPSEFMLRSHCPACLAAWLDIPLQRRRSGLIASCTQDPLPTGATFPIVLYAAP